jgi:putative SOS response-associated peptidase YedK
MSVVCGRIGYRITATELAAAYPWLREAPEVGPRYNVAPTDPVVVVDGAAATLVTWGIDGSRGGLFNLRAETAARAVSYRHLLLTNRVVVPVSHFYEWRSEGSRRVPVAIFRSDGRPISLAGLVGQHAGAPAVTILTTTPNRDLAALHDRMPVVLSDADARAWVRDRLTPEQLARMLGPCPDGFLELRPASPLVNGVRNDGPQLLDPDVLPPHHQLELLP